MLTAYVEWLIQRHRGRGRTCRPMIPGREVARSIPARGCSRQDSRCHRSRSGTRTTRTSWWPQAFARTDYPSLSGGVTCLDIHENGQLDEAGRLDGAGIGAARLVMGRRLHVKRHGSTSPNCRAREWGLIAEMESHHGANGDLAT